jgi:hypothetical protein
VSEFSDTRLGASIDITGQNFWKNMTSDTAQKRVREEEAGTRIEEVAELMVSTSCSV